MLEVIMAAAALTATAAHTETLSHRDRAIDLHYRAQIELSTMTKGAHVPTRGLERACHWEARVIVERQRADGALAQRLPVAREANGTTHGACHKDNIHVQRVAARALGDLNHALREAALADRPTVLAEMEAAHPRSTQ